MCTHTGPSRTLPPSNSRLSHQHWLWLLIPLIFGIAMMYKAVRVESMEDGGYWRQVGLMTLQILGVFIGLGVGFLILVQFLVPMLPSS